MMRGPARALALLLAAGCGTGTDGKPVAPSTTPAPAPEPEPAPEPPPRWPAVAQIMAEPLDPEGYYEGEVIVVLVDFDSRRNVTVEGAPRLAIQIGEHVRLADYLPWSDWPTARWGQRFRYDVGANDLDADGISIEADAIDFSDGAFVDGAGVEIEVEVHTVTSNHVTRDHVQFEPGEPMDTHRVLGRPSPRTCTDERERAMNHSRFVGEWDGTPFRVDWINSFPHSVSEADVAQLLEPLALLDAKIEDQLGYRIIEAGDVLPVPDGMQPGWNADQERFRRTCPLPREPGNIQGFYMDDTNYGGGADGQANSSCGSFCYLRPMLEKWPVPGGTSDALTLHEMFHVLGFVHFDNDQDRLARGQGVRMSYTLTREPRPGAEAVRWHDIDLLRCIFPKAR